MWPIRRSIAIAGMWCILASGIVPALSAPPLAREYDVKAAFLLNFTKFTEWPASAFPDEKAPISLCVYGKDPFGPILDQIVRGEAVDQRKLMVRRIEAIPAAQTCSVIFFAAETKDTPETLPRVAPGVLTVGEGEPFLREGGMIALVIDNGRVRFSISQSAAERAGLKLSSRLLSLARAVE